MCRGIKKMFSERVMLTRSELCHIKKTLLNYQRLRMSKISRNLIAWRFPSCVNLGCQVGDLYVNCLIFFILWWNRAHSVNYLISWQRNIFAFNAVWKERKINEHEKITQRKGKCDGKKSSFNVKGKALFTAHDEHGINKLMLWENKTYSEMCTKISSPPSFGVMNPWPFERQKLFTVPWIKGFRIARSHLYGKW